METYPQKTSKRTQHACCVLIKKEKEIMNNQDNPSMATPKKEYRYIIDPGHGWLEVPGSEIVALNIEDKISAYSYISEDRQTVYLEEDCDLSVFLIAMRQNFNIVEVYQDDTFVRALDHYGNS